jgi:two-component system cell cycle response regulator DivK
MARILVVEDNPANMKFAALVLRGCGHEVLQAADAAEGLAAARRERPDLILMDIQLPGMDGLTATRQIKADPITRDIPVLALTALAMQGDAERIGAAGCDGYIAKPIRYKDLLQQLQARLAPARGQSVPNEREPTWIKRLPAS